MESICTVLYLVDLLSLLLFFSSKKYYFFLNFRAGELANFLVAPAPDFFLSGSDSWFFSQAAPAPGIFFSSDSGSKGSKKTWPGLLTIG